jgi:hypothetical protein
VLLCYLRHPGRVLEANEIPPPELLTFIADQLDMDAGAFAEYRRRDQSRREQLADLMTRLGYRSFDPSGPDTSRTGILSRARRGVDRDPA